RAVEAGLRVGPAPLIVHADDRVRGGEGGGRAARRRWIPPRSRVRWWWRGLARAGRSRSRRGSLLGQGRLQLADQSLFLRDRRHDLTLLRIQRLQQRRLPLRRSLKLLGSP